MTLYSHVKISRSFSYLRYKLLKHYVQSGAKSENFPISRLIVSPVLLGVPSVVVGFRQPNGILASIQSFDTIELPNW